MVPECIVSLLKLDFKSLAHLSNVTPLPVHCSPSVSDRVPTQGKQVKQPGQEHEDPDCVSIWPATSLLCIHGPTSEALPADLQHLPALSAPAAAQPGREGGECAATIARTFLCIHTFLLVRHSLSLISLSRSSFLILVLRHLEWFTLRSPPSSVCARR